MLYAGLDLSRKRLDVHLLEESGATKEVTAVCPDADALRTLAASTARFGEPVLAVIESMNGARFVHDTLELCGWDVEICDAQKVKGLAPLACNSLRPRGSASFSRGSERSRTLPSSSVKGVARRNVVSDPTRADSRALYEEGPVVT